jgi:hypothetical protein
MALNTPYPFNGFTNPPIRITPGASPVPIQVLKAVGFPGTITPVLIHDIVKTDIGVVSYVYNSNPGNAYPWKTLTHLNIALKDGTVIAFELQTVENQGTWNTGTEAACVAAVTAINASLP